MKYSPILKDLYKKNINKLIKKLKYKCCMQVPKLLKIVISKGLGSYISDKKMIDYSIEEISLISGQKAVICLSKKDESNFNLRKGVPIGVKVTLRRDKMFEFLYKLITISLPRVRDFNGLNINSFDGRGNYNFGIKEQIIFPEISIDKVRKISGMNITFVTSSKSNKESFYLLKYLGVPFKKN